jgi:PIN domain nuclease of toxin-antitoxin system
VTPSGLVLDASALIALVLGEPQGDTVARALDQGPAHLSAVTAAEVMGKLRRLGTDVRRLGELLIAAQVAVEPFTPGDVGYSLQVQDLDDARRALLPEAAPPQHRTRLSLGDRCCVALAMRLGVPVLTSDTTWAALRGPVEVRLFR